MPTEVALLESRALRVEQMGRVDILDKVKSLVMLPDGIHVRTEDVARYFEVSTASVRRLTERHQEEFAENGLRVLSGSEVQSFHSDMMSLWKGEGVELSTDGHAVAPPHPPDRSQRRHAPSRQRRRPLRAHLPPRRGGIAAGPVRHARYAGHPDRELPRRRRQCAPGARAGALPDVRAAGQPGPEGGGDASAGRRDERAALGPVAGRRTDGRPFRRADGGLRAPDEGPAAPYRASPSREKALSGRRRGPAAAGQGRLQSHVSGARRGSPCGAVPPGPPRCRRARWTR